MEGRCGDMRRCRMQTVTSRLTLVKYHSPPPLSSNTSSWYTCRPRGSSAAKSSSIQRVVGSDARDLTVKHERPHPYPACLQLWLQSPVHKHLCHIWRETTSPTEATLHARVSAIVHEGHISRGHVTLGISASCSSTVTLWPTL